MENLTESRTKKFKGAGYLIGFVIGSLVAILFVAITGIEALIGAIAGAIAIPLGIALEKKFQGQNAETKPGNKLFFISFLLLGIASLTLFLYLNYFK